MRQKLSRLLWGPLYDKSSQGRLSYAVVPLRLFIGVTFAFAGLQKLANPAFFNKGDPISIQNQLASYARLSPIGGILHHLQPFAVPVGVGMALAELAVGTGMLFGFLTRIAALGGMVTSLMLFLSVSYNANPYYTGADIVWFFAFSPFLISGDPGPLSLDRPVAARLKARQSEGVDPLRRRLLRGIGAGLAAAAAVAAGADAAIGRLLSSPSRASGGTTRLSGSPGGSPSGGGGSMPQSGEVPAGAQPIGSVSQVEVGGAAMFTDPISSDPAYVYRPTQGKLVAFDAVCPHAGCTVAPRPSIREAVCPCHGSRFDLATGQVLGGPATSPLTPIKVIVGSNGTVYVLD